MIKIKIDFEVEVVFIYKNKIINVFFSFFLFERAYKCDISNRSINNNKNKKDFLNYK